MKTSAGYPKPDTRFFINLKEQITMSNVLKVIKLEGKIWNLLSESAEMQLWTSCSFGNKNNKAILTLSTEKPNIYLKCFPGEEFSCIALDFNTLKKLPSEISSKINDSDSIEIQSIRAANYFCSLFYPSQEKERKTKIEYSPVIKKGKESKN